jgi:hypothetical protein
VVLTRKRAADAWERTHGTPWSCGGIGHCSNWTGAGLESNHPSPVSLLFPGHPSMHQNPFEDVPARRQILRAESQRVLGINSQWEPHERHLRVALEPLAHKEYLSPSLHLNKSSAAVP